MFITEMELLQARLAAGKRLNDSHILKEILQEDRSSERICRRSFGALAWHWHSSFWTRQM